MTNGARRSFFGGVFLFLIVGLGTACRTSNSTSKPLVIGGRLADTVGQLRGIVFIGNKCTGTKVSDRFFLTAGHCVLADNSFDHGKKIKIFYGLNIDDPNMSLEVTIDFAKMHPDYLRKWNQSNIDQYPIEPESTMDIALIKVQEDTPEIQAADLAFVTLKPGDQVVLAGMGREWDQLSGGEPAGGEPAKRQKSNPSKVEMVTPRQFRIENIGVDGISGRTASGDSGGPTYLATTMADTPLTQVVGVNSYKLPAQKVFSSSARLDLPEVKSWLEAVLTGKPEPLGRGAGEPERIDWNSLKQMTCANEELTTMLKRTTQGLMLSAKFNNGSAIYTNQALDLEVLTTLDPPAAIFKKKGTPMIAFRGFGSGRQAALHHKVGFKQLVKVVSSCEYEISE